MRWYAWWLNTAVATFAQDHGLELGHANGEENFPFTRIGQAPQGIKPRVTQSGIEGKDATRRSAGDGSYVSPYHVNDAIMGDLFDLCLSEVVELLRFS